MDDYKNSFTGGLTYRIQKKIKNNDITKSRETKPEKGGEEIQEICQCCGYEINRVSINLMVNIQELGFLGPGFPLFYNYIRYCVLMLFFLFLIQGIPNIVFNNQGHFCYDTPEEENHNQKFKAPCSFNFIVVFSLANLLDTPEMLNNGLYFSIGAMLIQIILGIVFRKNQRQLENVINDQNLTPSDFTIMVSNIPPQLENPEQALTNLFNNNETFKHKVEVAKIVLVYDIKEIQNLEQQIQVKIKEKQKILNYNFDLKNQTILLINNQIHELEHQLQEKELQIQKQRHKFKGIAFISFKTNIQKELVLKHNKLDQIKRFQNYFQGGRSQQYSSSIYFYDRHLYIEQAPEPNDIDWEYIHCSTIEKIKARIISLMYLLMLTTLTFTVIASISYYQSLMIEHAYEESLENNQSLDNNPQIDKVVGLSYFISMIIVLFNKFIVPVIVHHIIEYEKWSNKTKQNASFATKLTLVLFTNTALITFSVEIILFHNYYGIGGGMIYSEFWVFVLNAFVPPLAWIIDPWSIIKNFKRNQELKKDNKSMLTQKEANMQYFFIYIFQNLQSLMEFPDYSMGKRYADIMKTMWFTFFYSPVIPMGTLWSIIGVTLYYYTDKYNLIYRRTVKENIGKQLTIDMIELLEYCLVFHTVFFLKKKIIIQFILQFGNFFFKKQLFDDLDTKSIIFFSVSIIICFLPKELINEKLFPIKEVEQENQYFDYNLLFDTDYDRENPVLRKQALKAYYSDRNALNNKI
ncbi:hypothetical protein IMG5_113410 [Ichthyophthirius multifiliis]|uniref:CSC1/OSCA1-like cytosolic domain-containing protein n=1 Tax=Ichthyophthirius multifiliis TaxID=5932 RepID=G0QU00_ICHMU|nr:hypothetical protein IMG5_113410 [Ichthyophthirius multifiliis]EGR31304.1 hypothetical protein IMG5_113410 [Ichthyophthirius multifiliis]|eukprot:XP_004034790.1 hypothetical protein IMG5_113410 [Ichthyophthirius multifiliis]